MLARLRAAQQLLLPLCEITVLQRQFGERRGGAFPRGDVEGEQVAQHHLHGPGIADDVMHVQQQYRAPVAEAQQHDPQQRTAGQVEGVRRFAIHLAARRGLGVGADPQVLEVEGNIYSIAHDLARRPVDLGKYGAQHFVPAHKLAYCLPQGRDIDFALDQAGARDVVGRLLDAEMLDHPEAVLRMRHRVIRRRGRDGYRRHGGLAATPDQFGEAGNRRRSKHIL